MTTVKEIEFAISGLTPNHRYRIEIITADNDAEVLSLLRWNNEFSEWLPLTWEHDDAGA